MVTPARSDALQAFGAETPDPDETAAESTGASPAAGAAAASRRAVWHALIGIVVAAAAIVALFAATNRWLRPARAADGQLTLTTTPAAAAVLVDGKAAGMTPVALKLAPGSHTVVLRRGDQERTLPITIAAGGQVAQYVDWPAAAVAPATGRIVITTDHPGGRVALDGRARGTTPLTLDAVAAGPHTITVTADGTTTERKVDVAAGGTASLIFQAGQPAGPAAGWIAVSAPFDLQVFEGDDLVGASGAKVMLTAGRHDLRFVSRALGYAESRRVEVGAGRVVAIRIDAPKATVSANARPWADLFIDGTGVGQTPLANLSVPIGTHKVVFRHPQLGERDETVTITVDGPNRISADFTRK